MKQLQCYDVYLVFDRYREYSTKGVTRVSRGTQLSRVMPLPPPKVILTIPDNKRQLISLIVDDLCSNTVFLETSTIRRLVVTGEDPVSVELTSTVTIKQEDFGTNHEETDNILAHQMVVVASEKNRHKEESKGRICGDKLQTNYNAICKTKGLVFSSR